MVLEDVAVKSPEDETEVCHCRIIGELFFCRGLMMLGLSMAPRPAAGSAPALGFAP